jgi:hypothetical protein
MAVVTMPRLALEALFVLRRTIDGALLSLSAANPMREECDDRSTSHPPTARSARSHSQCVRIRIPRATRAEVVVLLKLLMSEHIAAGAALPPEAVNE